MRKTVIVLIVLALMATFAPQASAHVLRERVWMNYQEYELIEAGNPPSPTQGPTLPYYLIGAIDEAHPQGPGHEGALGPHDHVIPIVPVGNGGEFTPLWRLTLVLPGPNAILFGENANVLVRFVSPPDPPAGPLPLVYAATLPGSGATPQLLQSAEAIQQAADLGLVTLVDLGVVFVGPVVAIGKAE